MVVAGDEVRIEFGGGIGVSVLAVVVVWFSGIDELDELELEVDGGTVSEVVVEVEVEVFPVVGFCLAHFSC